MSIRRIYTRFIQKKTEVKTRIIQKKTEVKTRFIQKKTMVKLVWLKVYDYVRYDLKEIAFPSSLPFPPGYVPPRKKTWTERYHIFTRACRLYAASWVRDIGPDLRPEYYRMLREREAAEAARAATEKKDPTPEETLPTWDELAEASRGGMEKLRPALQKIYMIRMSGYKDALKSFIIGYQEGIRDVMEKKETVESELKDGAPKL